MRALCEMTLCVKDYSLKGGDPAAPSDTATLLRLHPNYQSHLRLLPPAIQCSIQICLLCKFHCHCFIKNLANISYMLRFFIRTAFEIFIINFSNHQMFKNGEFSRRKVDKILCVFRDRQRWKNSFLSFEACLGTPLNGWLAHRLRVLPTLMVWRAVCTRPGNVFTAAFWSAITSNSAFMQASFSLQSELRLFLGICSASRLRFPLFSAIVVRV